MTCITWPRPAIIALAGNPNVGKTTLFNRLTGARQHVANYPGVTVERREGRCRAGEVEIQVWDLPGAYSLNAQAPDELAARQSLLDDRPDAVVNVVDASNLQRNLYLTLQLLELQLPMVVALTMQDVAEHRGARVDPEKLSQALGVPVVEVCAHRGYGADAVLQAVHTILLSGSTQHQTSRGVLYQPPIEQALSELMELLSAHQLAEPHRARWTAARLLEGDAVVEATVNDSDVMRAIQAIRHRLGHTLGEPDAAMAADRYQHAAHLLKLTVIRTAAPARSVTERIDAIVTHRWLGIPLFLAVMYGVFQLTFLAGAPLMDGIEQIIAAAAAGVSQFWPTGSDSVLRSLLVDGVLGGVGAVLVFLPNIVLLFLAISILEGTGYMARAAFIMDRVMHTFGLHGKSFIPFLVGFGCTVPAIMATRTIENQRDRLLTMLVLPLVSCGARLPIYALIIPAFFPATLHAPLLWLIYVIGLVMAGLMAHLLSRTALRGEPAMFFLEMPPYHLPAIRDVLLQMLERAWLYLSKAATVILAISVLLWALSTYPQRTEFTRDYVALQAEAERTLSAHPERLQARMEELAAAEQAERLEYTVTGRLGRFMEPVLRPIGFDWRIGSALIGAVAAKEVFVAQLGIVYAVGDADEHSRPLRERLRSQYTPLTAWCIMLFCLISSPCMATVAVTRRESGSWRWAAVQFVGLTVLAWLLTTLVYQAGLLLGWGG